ncbi:MAG: hypothetical protein U0835_11095, partial [Isosphaeraceae bacterium]
TEYPGAEAPGPAAVPEVERGVVVPHQVVSPPPSKIAPTHQNVAAQLPSPTWVEPPDPSEPRTDEDQDAPGVLARFLPAWASSSVPVESGPNQVVRVRRVPGTGDVQARSSVRAALDLSSMPVVELADNGPFFESDLRPIADMRTIRGAKGFRPVIALERPRADGRSASSSLVDVGDRTLVIDGVDLVVDASRLPPTLTELFLVRGGTLVLRDSSITVVNRSGRGLTLVKTQTSANPSRVLLDRSLVRGSFTTVIETTGGPSDVSLLRSVVLNAQGSIHTASGPAAPAGVLRRVSVVRSVLTSHGSLFELADTPPGLRPRPHAFRVYRSHLARFQSSYNASLVASRGDTGRPTELLDWQGDSNSYAGWTRWLASPGGRSARVTDLAAAQGAWPGQERSSRSTTQPWPMPLAMELLIPSQLRVHAPGRLDTLSVVSRPNPWLFEETFGAFAHVPIPGLESLVVAPAVPSTPGGMTAPPGMSLSSEGSMMSGRIAGFGARVPAGYTPTPASPYGSSGENPGTGPVDQYAKLPFARDLTFDADAPAHHGDLGRYLSDTVKPGDTLVRVRVTGTGTHPFSPVRLPRGTSLEVRVNPSVPGQPPRWVAAKDVSGDALIGVQRGSLALLDFRLEREGTNRLERLISVEGGHLVLVRCRVVAPGQVEPGGGGLVAFHAPTTEPVASVGRTPWPFDAPVGRPTCRIVESVLTTGGEAMHAEIGRGLVAISNSILISGGPALTLVPGKVARSRFQADLVLDRCTLTSERAFVSVGAWKGTEPGPDRPWLVASSRCAFLGFYDHPARESILLQTDPDGLARGALFWQSEGDALDVPAFTGQTGSSPVGSRRQDVRNEWVSLWGDSHARAVSGPRLPSGLPSVRPVVRLRPSEVQPGDLAIDPDYPPGRRPPLVGADFSRLDIAPTARQGQGR